MTLTRTHLFGFLGLVALAFILYWAKAEAQAVREHVLVLQNDVDAERRAVRTLEAELAWVERPDRLEAAAGKMGMQPVAATRMGDLTILDEVAPLRAAATPASTPQSAVTANSAVHLPPQKGTTAQPDAKPASSATVAVGR